LIDSFEGVVWRHVPAGAHPLHAGWILRADGRWNRPGRYGCLYTALTPEAAAAEWRKYVHRSTRRAARRHRDLASIEIRVRPVADVAETGFRRRYQIPLAQLTSDDEQDWEACRSLADLLRAEGYRALHVPSAALAGATNLVLYLEGASADLVMDEGGDRRPLNYGPDPFLGPIA
jgi:RES domain-containing protein